MNSPVLHGRRRWSPKPGGAQKEISTYRFASGASFRLILRTKGAQKYNESEIEMKSEIPGVSRAVVVRAEKQRRSEDRKQEVGLASQCSLAHA